MYGHWSRLPAGQRPRLVVFGESLGSFGGETAFSGTDDIRNRTSGVLWVSPGHGHTYGMLQGAASWAAIVPPPGWTAARTAALGSLPAG